MSLYLSIQEIVHIIKENNMVYTATIHTTQITVCQTLQVPPQDWKVGSSRYSYAKSEYEEKQMRKSNKF